MGKVRILSIFGTRPEVIKMAPVLLELKRRQKVFDCKNVATGQHYEMCEPLFELFSIAPDYDLAIMKEDQSLNSIIISILKRLQPILEKTKPDLVLVQGDTSSAFGAALACYHNKIQVGHIEAGLRTMNKYNPFPEEINRRLISILADFHFAPTAKARANLLSEGQSEANIYVTGNTVIDSLLHVAGQDYVFQEKPLATVDFNNRKIITVTTHRRESFGEPLQNILHALRRIVDQFPQVEIILPVHYNPHVRTSIMEALGGIERIRLIEPLSYEAFVHLLNLSYAILTDSGGVQEEAPSLGKPVLVLRETTERPEGLEAGTAKMVGTDTDAIVSSLAKLITDNFEYRRMANVRNPYGDGKASVRIVDTLERIFVHG